MQLPYNVNEIGNNAFTFITDQGLEYTCRYKNITTYLDAPVLGIYDIAVFDFEFYPYDSTPEIKKYRDERISVTIKALLAIFFGDSLKILIYICDSSDNRQRQRQALFKLWHRDFPNQINRLQIDIENEGDNIVTHGCMFSRKDFPYPEVLKTELIDKAKDIMLEKYGG